MSTKQCDKKTVKQYINGNIGIQVKTKDLKSIRKSETTLADAMWAHVQNALDFDLDTLPVTDGVEESAGQKGRRLFSFQTMMEYFITEADLSTLLNGRFVKLRAMPASESTRKAMLWLG